MNATLQSLTYAQLRELHYICAGRRSFGFNPALNPATASKDALITYIIATHGEEKARDSLARLRAGDTIPQTIFRERASKPASVEAIPAAVVAAPAQSTAAPADALAAAIAAIAATVTPANPGSIDADAVRAIIAEEIARLDLVRTVQIVHAQDAASPADPVNVGQAHAQFPALLAMCNARDKDGHRLNVWMPGPVGSGKTSAAKQAAKALGLECAEKGVTLDAYELFGFRDAKGDYVRTPFRDMYENGGIFVCDECDGWGESATLALNAALANGRACFPDGMIDRHPDFICIATANTYGTGPTAEFVGRNKLDDAFLDRFVLLPWQYDDALELSYSVNKDWTKTVQRFRRAAESIGLKSIISPRAGVQGAALLASGLPESVVMESVIKRAMSEQQWQRLQSAARGA